MLNLRTNDYDVDNLGLSQPWLDEPAPSADSTFTNGVNPALLQAGEIQGNTTLIDGYIQSSNYVAATDGWRISPTTAEFNVGVSVDSIDIGGSDATSFHVDVDGNMWLGAASFAAAPAKISNAGAITGSSVTITGGAISGTPISSIPNNTTTDISLLEKTWTMVFSVTDSNTVAWTSGTITMSNGRTFSINSGNTGNMAALTYIYLDPAVSSVALQTTTTASTAMGANKALIGTAQNNTVTASFIPYGPGQPLVDGANIGALSITASQIAASTITAGKMNVTTLSSIVADIGTITAGTITLNTTGYVRGGQTDYATGTGFFLGYSGAAYKFSIGDSSKYLTWDGSSLTIAGTLISQITVFTASETLQTSADTEQSHTTNTYNKEKEIQVYYPGTVRVKFDMKDDGTGGGSALGRVYINDVAVGTERLLDSTVYTTYSEDFSVNIGDKVQLYIRTNGLGTVLCRNFRMYYTLSTSSPSVANLN